MFPDDVHIPYYDPDKNDYRHFMPDFVFWMCRGNKYRIVFVDPKGTAHTSSYHKIDGYREIFAKGGGIRFFKHGKLEVSVSLFLYNPDAEPLQPYMDYWIKDPSPIFTKGAV